MKRVFNMLRTVILLINFTICAAQVPDLVVQRSHTNSINVVAISPDNRIFATGSIDNSIRIWELKTGKLLKVINFIDSPYTLEFTTDGNYLYAGGYGINSEHVKVYDTKTWEMKGTKMSGGILHIDFSKKHDYLGMASSKGYIAVWEDEGQTFKNYYQFSEPSVSSRQFGFSENGDFIVSGASGFSENYPFNIWSINSGEVVYSDLSDQAIESVQFINQDRYLLLETRNWTGANNISIINWKEKKVVTEFKGSHPTVFNNKEQIIFADENKQIAIRNLNDPKTKWKEMKWSDKEMAADIAVSESDKYVVAVSNDIAVYDVENNKILYRIPRHNWTESMSFSPMGNQLSFGTRAGDIINWNLQSNTLENLKGHRGEVMDLFYNTHGNLMSSIARDSMVIIWDATTNKIMHRYQFNDNDFHSTSINPSGEWVAVSLKDTVYSFYSVTGEIKAKSSFSWVDEKEGDTVYIAENMLVYSPNNRDFAGIASNFCFVYDVFESKYRMQLSTRGGSFESITFNSTGSMVAAGGYYDTLVVYDLDKNQVKQKIVYENRIYPLCVAFSPSEDVLAVGLSDGQVELRDPSTGQLIVTFEGHGNLINELSFREDGKILASSSWDGNMMLWDVSKKQKLCELYVFEDKTWAAIDVDGRYDASNGGRNDHLHFVLNTEEVIALNQLKERYYEPGLIQKLLDISKEPLRDVAKLKSVALYPKINLKLDGDILTVSLAEREGGLGPTSLFINSKEINPNINPNNSLKFDIDLSEFKKYYKKNDNNVVSIVTRNQQGYLESEKRSLEYYFKATPSGGKNGFQFTEIQPKMYAVVIGTADYRGSALDLKYADKDAHYIAHAIEAAGEALLGEGNVDVDMLTTDSPEKRPVKSNVQKIFEKLSDKTTAEDILVLYLSGHGVSYGGQDGQFYYLTTEVESGDISDEVIRENYTISTSELTEWIAKIPAKKQVLILDACASGKAIEDIQVQKKAVSSSQVRALERLKDRTGMFVIAGSAADKVSFEAGQYGQSLLTYSLLSGMKGRALRDNEFVDVMQLFQYALEEVPNLAKNIGGVQKPMMSIPYGGSSFDIGRITEDVDIQLEQIKPVFIRTNFQEEFAFDDVLNLSSKVDAKFKDIAISAKSSELIFVDVAKYPTAYSIKGRYELVGSEVTINAKVFSDKKVIESFSLSGSKEALDSLVTEIIEKGTTAVENKKKK